MFGLTCFVGPVPYRPVQYRYGTVPCRYCTVPYCTLRIALYEQHITVRYLYVRYRTSAYGEAFAANNTETVY